MHLKSRITLAAALAMLTFSVYGQKNTLLEPTFWKSNPDVAAIQSEISKGANPSQLTSSAFDPVVYAINANASTEAIKFLLAQPGNDVNKITHDSRNYIHWAASRGNVEVVEYLLSKGAKTNVEDSHGYTPVNFAAAGGQANTKVYDVFVKNGVDLKKGLTHEGANALLLAVPAAKDFTLIDYFVSKGLPITSTDANGNTAFNYAVRNGNIEMLKALVAKGVTYNDNAMIMAAQGSRGGSNTLALYQFLESLKINPNAIGKNGENVLHAIVRRPKQEEIINYFVSKGVDINKADNDGNTPFMNAAATNADITLLTSLLTQVKNINHINNKGVSALALAVRNNTPEVVSFLVSKGADISVIDKNGDNLAAYLIQGYSPMRAEAYEAKTKLLVEKGLKLSAPQKNGNTLYHLAMAKDDLELLKRLEGLKLDVNSKNSEGLTILHKAAMTAKNDAILKYLVSIGAKKDLTTEFKETAYDLAKENEYLAKNNVSIDFLKQ